MAYEFDGDKFHVEQGHGRFCPRKESARLIYRRPLFAISLQRESEILFFLEISSAPSSLSLTTSTTKFKPEKRTTNQRKSSASRILDLSFNCDRLYHLELEMFSQCFGANKTVCVYTFKFNTCQFVV